MWHVAIPYRFVESFLTTYCIDNADFVNVEIHSGVKMKTITD